MIADTARKFNDHQMVFSNGENVGHVEGDTYHRYAQRSHQLRKPPAWAYTPESLEKAKGFGATRLVIHIKGGCTIKASMADMDHYGIDIDRRYGPQRALRLSYWKTVSLEPSNELQQWADNVGRKLAQEHREHWGQLSLFGEVTE